MSHEIAIADILYKTAVANPRKNAIVFNSIHIRYDELYKSVCELANLLIDIGVNIGSKTAILFPRSPEYIIAYFAVSMAGSVVVPLDPQLTERELITTINYCDVEVIISQKQFLSTILNISTKVKTTQILLLDRDAVSQKPYIATYDALSQRIDVCTKLSSVHPSLSVDPQSCALLLHTSGTTNSPKRVMLSHRNIIVNAYSHIASLGLHQDDKVLIALPMHFGYCNTAQLITHILLGGTLVLLPTMFTPHQFCYWVESESVTTFTGVPTMLYYLQQFNRLNNYDLSSLRYFCFGGSLVSHDRLLKLIHRLPSVGFVQTYGQTEASPRITTLLPEDLLLRSDSVGKAIPGVSVQIIREKGEIAPPQTIGEIAVQGDNVMMGYYKRPEITSQVIKNGQLYTGDMGYLDEDGFLYLVGRKKNIIIRGGMNIYPEEIEELLLEHPAISEVAVIGEEHPLQGEVPIAFIVTQPNCEVTANQLITYCKTSLSPSKIPFKIEFCKTLPKTYNQKIQRYKLPKNL